MHSFVARNTIFQVWLPRSYLTVIAKMANWKQEKEKYLDMPLAEKRKHYVCNQYFGVKDILDWSTYCATKNLNKFSKEPPFTLNKNLNSELAKKVSIWNGDITALEIDAVVNAANESLAGGGGVDGAIHKAASKQLLQAECQTLRGCPTGDAKITGGYRLPARLIIHTVGPRNQEADLLRKCYSNSLDLALQHNLKTIAFPCISTGVYSYPNEGACHVALETVRSKLEKNPDKFERIIFVVFTTTDIQAYEKFMQVYFPVE